MEESLLALAARRQNNSHRIPLNRVGLPRRETDARPDEALQTLGHFNHNTVLTGKELVINLGVRNILRALCITLLVPRPMREATGVHSIGCP